MTKRGIANLLPCSHGTCGEYERVGFSSFPPSRSHKQIIGFDVREWELTMSQSSDRARLVDVDSYLDVPRVSPRDLLQYFDVPDHPLVYVLGCLESRVTIHDQQVRAANLIWALQQVVAPNNVAVIGAGFAGVTAAIAAERIGLSATVFEAKSKACHIQAGSQRKVHPRLYDWPLAGWDDAHALPFANWTPGTVAEAVSSVEASALEHGVQFRFGHRVTGLQWSAVGRPCVTVNSLAGEEPLEFDVIIVAVGFGLEKTLPAYWEHDELEGETAAKFTVGGLGDGALVDVARIRLGGGQHDFYEVLETLAHETPVAVRHQLMALERAAERAAFRSTLEPSKPAQPGPSEVITWPHEVPELILKDGLERIARHDDALAPLHALTREYRRPGTRVTLVGPGPGPYRLAASRLNRWLLFLLLRNDQFVAQNGTRYFQGKLVGTRQEIYLGDKLVDEEADGRVVPRFGPTRDDDAWLSQLFRALGGRQPAGDVARTPQWPHRVFELSAHESARLHTQSGLRYFLAVRRGPAETELPLQARPRDGTLSLEVAVVADTAGAGMRDGKTVEQIGRERAVALLREQEPFLVDVAIFEVRLRSTASEMADVEPVELGSYREHLDIAKVERVADLVGYETVRHETE